MQWIQSLLMAGIAIQKQIRLPHTAIINALHIALLLMIDITRKQRSDSVISIIIFICISIQYFKKKNCDWTRVINDSTDRLRNVLQLTDCQLVLMLQLNVGKSRSKQQLCESSSCQLARKNWQQLHVYIQQLILSVWLSYHAVFTLQLYT